MSTELENLDNGEVKITVSEQGHSLTGWVSSHHLVPTKERQLTEALARSLALMYR